LTLTGAGRNKAFYGLLSGKINLVLNANGSALTLCRSNTYSGNTTISAGTLIISGAIGNAAQVIATNNATLQLAAGRITANTVRIYTNAFLLGCGTIKGTLINDGTVVSDCGTNVTFNGAVTNNGTMRITAGTTLVATGPFVNYGVLDLINAVGGLPSGLVNNGVVLNSSSVQVSQIAVSGQDVRVQIFLVIGHIYQMQRSASLNPTAWADLGASQSGTGGVLTFTNSAALVQPQGFYRFKVN
jgi:autotransporter-associated beta strand protein